MIRPSDAGAPHEPHGKGCAGIGVSVRAGLTPVDEATPEMCGQVIYPAAVLKAAPNAEAAREFLAYLQTDRAATVFEGVGFVAV